MTMMKRTTKKPMKKKKKRLRRKVNANAPRVEKAEDAEEEEEEVCQDVAEVKVRAREAKVVHHQLQKVHPDQVADQRDKVE